MYLQRDQYAKDAARQQDDKVAYENIFAHLMAKVIEDSAEEKTSEQDRVRAREVISALLQKLIGSKSQQKLVLSVSVLFGKYDHDQLEEQDHIRGRLFKSMVEAVVAAYVKKSSSQLNALTQELPERLAAIEATQVETPQLESPQRPAVVTANQDSIDAECSALEAVIRKNESELKAARVPKIEDTAVRLFDARNKARELLERKRLTPSQEQSTKQVLQRLTTSIGELVQQSQAAVNQLRQAQLLPTVNANKVTPVVVDQVYRDSRAKMENAEPERAAALKQQEAEDAVLAQLLDDQEKLRDQEIKQQIENDEQIARTLSK